MQVLGSAVPCPAKSLDYFLWGRLKSLVYAENVENREQLVDGIMDASETIRADPEQHYYLNSKNS